MVFVLCLVALDQKGPQICLILLVARRAGVSLLRPSSQVDVLIVVEILSAMNNQLFADHHFLVLTSSFVGHSVNRKSPFLSIPDQYVKLALSEGLLLQRRRLLCRLC